MQIDQRQQIAIPGSSAAEQADDASLAAGNNIILAPARLWTIQDVRALDALSSTGMLRSTSSRIPDDILPAYAWMAARLRERCGEPPEGVQYPMWSWSQFESEWVPRPDLLEAALLEPGTEGVCIELIVPRESVLLSDFELWHYPLNGWFLGLSEAEDIDFEARCVAAGQSPEATFAELSPHLQRAVEHSWHRIFDLESVSEWAGAGARQERRIQAVAWEFRAEQVKSIERFVAR